MSDFAASYFDAFTVPLGEIFPARAVSSDLVETPPPAKNKMLKADSSLPGAIQCRTPLGTAAIRAAG